MNETPNIENAESGEQQESNAAKLRARLDRLEDMYFRPGAYETKIAKWEVDELREHRPWLWEGEAISPESTVLSPQSGSGSDSGMAGTADMGRRGGDRPNGMGDAVDTYREMAHRLALHYRTPDGGSMLKWDIVPKVVSDWKLNKRLPANAPTPPGRGAHSRLSVREWIAWFDRYLWPEWKLDSTVESPGQVPLHALEDQEKREKIELERWERQKALGRYIEVGAAGRMAGGEMRQLGEYWRHRNEGELVAASQKKLLELGVSVEVAGMHTDWLRLEQQKITDAIEDKVAAQAQKYQEALKQEIEKQQS